MSNRNNKTEVKSQPKKASKKPANAPVSPQKAQKGKNFKSTKTAPQRQQRANKPISQTATKKASASSSPNKTANNSKKRKEEIRKIEPSYDQLIPIIRMVDEGQTGFMLKNGKYMKLLTAKVTLYGADAAKSNRVVTTAKEPAPAKSRYAEHSLLANGKWVKIRVKEFHGNNGQLESAINKWFEENEDKYDFVDYKMATCQYRESQTKTTVLIFYKPAVSHQ